MRVYEKVSGENKEHDVRAFTISTCPWCKKTKKLLKELDVEYEYVDVDKLSGDDRKKVLEEIEKYNPLRNAPTLVIDEGKKVITGYKEEKIREVLENE